MSMPEVEAYLLFSLGWIHYPSICFLALCPTTHHGWGHAIYFIWLDFCVLSGTCNYSMPGSCSCLEFHWHLEFEGCCILHFIFPCFCLCLLLLTISLIMQSGGDKARVIQTLLFVAGINTLTQALFGTRLPAVVGGSFAYVIPIAYIISDTSLQQITDHHEVSFPLVFLIFVCVISGKHIINSS